MAGVGGTNRDERRRLVLEAADALLRSRSVDWGRLFTYDELSNEAGIDRKQISDDFGSKAQIVDTLIEFYLAPESNDSDDWLTEFIEHGAVLLADENTSFEDGLRLLGMLSHEHARRDRRQTGRIALWSLARADPQVSSKLRSLYRYYGDGYIKLIEMAEAWFELRGVRPRPGLTTEQFITGVTAFTEGLGIRAEFDPEAVADGLPATLLVAFAEAYFTDVDDPSTDAIGSRIGRWEAIPPADESNPED